MFWAITPWLLSVLKHHGCETGSVCSKLTVIAIPAKTLKLVLGAGHARATVLTRPVVTWAGVHALTDSPAFCECVGQIDLLAIDRHLDTKAVDIKVKLKEFYC